MLLAALRTWDAAAPHRAQWEAAVRPHGPAEVADSSAAVLTQVVVMMLWTKGLNLMLVEGTEPSMRQVWGPAGRVG